MTTLKIILVLLVVTLSVALFFLGYFFNRNDDVKKFRDYLKEQGYWVCKSFLNDIDPIHISEWDFHYKIKEYNKLKELYDSITDISYYKMLFSFKPLEEEYWLTEEQVDFLARNLR